MARDRWASRLRRWANRLDNGPYPGELVDLTYTPGANQIVIVDGVMQPPPPGKWEATIRVHVGRLTGKTMTGIMEVTK